MSRLPFWPGVAYLVERAAAGRTARPDPPPFDPDDPAHDIDDYLDLPSYVPVRAFADRAAAEVCREELEAEARAAVSPVEVAGPFGDPEAVAAGLRALGLDPPAFGDNQYDWWREFRGWWARHAGDLTAGHRAAVWMLFDHLRAYRVTEVAYWD